MNRKQLIVLILAGVVIAGLGIMLKQSRNKAYQQGNQRLGQQVFENFPLNDVEQITILQPQDQRLNLVRQGNGWVVQERNGYPANFDHVRDLLRKVWELKVAKPVKVGATQLARLQLTPPGQSTNSGTLVQFKGSGGKVLQTLTLGKTNTRESQGDSPMGGGWPNGRFIMAGSNVQSVALVSETFNNAEAKPADWIDKEFFKVEKPKLIGVTGSTNTWRISRESETNDWKLAETKPGEQLDSGKVSSVTSLFSYPSFNDVATNATPESTGLDKPLFTARIETVEGFNYDVKVGKKLADDRDDYFFQVNATANLVRERAAGKDEKPEDKAKLDKEHKEKVEKLEEKLNKEKALAKWVYIVPKYTLEPLFKDRKELLPEPPKPEDKKDATTQTQATPPAAPPQALSRTEPVKLPELPKLPDPSKPVVTSKPVELPQPSPATNAPTAPAVTATNAPAPADSGSK
jgi:hypothetical protein